MNNYRYLMKIMFFIMLLSFGFIFKNTYSKALTQDVFYVSTFGNDNNSGTESNPWRTIQKAADTLVAGQTVYIKSGTYSEKIKLRNSGKEEKYITYASYQEDTVIIDAKNVPDEDYRTRIIEINGNSYIKISGLIVQNNYFGAGIGNKGNNVSNIIIENNYIYNCSNQGIVLDNASYSVVRGNTTDNVCNSSFGECITFEKSNNIEVFENIIKNSYGSNGGEGIDVKYSHDIKIYNNTVHDMIRTGIYIDSWNGYNNNIDIFNNLVYNCLYGIVVSGEQSIPIDNVSIYNNVVYDTKKSGIGVVNWAKGNKPPVVTNIKIQNNTIAFSKFNNDNWNQGILIDNYNAKNVEVINNILYNTVIPINIDEANFNEVFISNNLYNSDDTEIKSYKEKNDFIGKPQFADFENKDFHLKSNSIGIDMGLENNIEHDFNNTKRPHGKTIDIGAFEYTDDLLNQIDSVNPSPTPTPIIEGTAKPTISNTTILLKVGDPNMIVNKQILEIDPNRGTVPVLKNGRVLLPIRSIIETFGGTIKWNEEEKVAEIELENIKIFIKINDKKSTVNNIEKQMDVVPEIINGRTFIPIRFVMENLNFKVLWNKDNSVEIRN